MNHFKYSARLLCCAALAAAVLVAGADTAAARHRNRSGGGTPGDFSYYLLSLSWSPAFCLDSPGSAECNGPRRYGFIVHGLWPENEDSRGPEKCAVHREVPDSVVDGIADLMPARGLVYHEWSAHGTCSGLEPAEFFALVREAHSRIVMPPEFTRPAGALEQPTSAVIADFMRANPRLPQNSLVVTCSRQSEPRLREVRVCLDRNLSPRGCSSDALRGACRSDQVLIPPVR